MSWLILSSFDVLTPMVTSTIAVMPVFFRYISAPAALDLNLIFKLAKPSTVLLTACRPCDSNALAWGGKSATRGPNTGRKIFQ